MRARAAGRNGSTPGGGLAEPDPDSETVIRRRPRLGADLDDLRRLDFGAVGSVPRPTPAPRGRFVVCTPPGSRPLYPPKKVPSEVLVRPCEEIRLVCLQGRTDDPIDSGRGRGFNLVPAAPVEDGFLKVLGLVVGGQDLSAEPPRERLGIPERDSAEAEQGADPGPVALATPPAEVACGELSPGEPELAG